MEPKLQHLMGALTLGDAQTQAAEAASGLPASAASAIVTIGHTPGMTIGQAARVAGVSHSVMVRIVEGLVGRGLIARAAGEDRRAVGLTLITAGMALREGILAARAGVLAGALTGVDAGALTPIVVQMRTTLTDGRRVADHMYRLCDEAVCSNCPVEAQALRCEQ